ncbi:MAG: UbiA family prenyltransferase [Chlorobi bacterium]|nr:UbiA family prenyltransferase [Chlorobiota bacterium]
MGSLSSKVPGLISLVRLQNVLVLLVAQTLVAWKVYGESLSQVLFDKRFVLMLLATGSAISAGYIIDHFYHLKRDRINRPAQTAWIGRVPVHIQLYLYFFLNFLTLVFAALISLRAAVFFGVYIFFIWLYFHKLQNRPLWRELFVTFLTAYPFFGVMLFFKQWNPFVLWAGTMFVILLFLKELIKNHLTLRGDMVQNIRTVLTMWGERRQALLFGAVWASAWIPWLALWRMDLPRPYRIWLGILAFMLGILAYIYFRKKYATAYAWIKFIILSGVFALFLL